MAEAGMVQKIPHRTAISGKRGVLIQIAALLPDNTAELGKLRESVKRPSPNAARN